MLVITTNQNDFETDIYSLVKAFYPAEEVKIYLGEEAGREETSSQAGLPDINIHFLDNRILLMIYSGESEPMAAGIDIDKTESRLEVKNALKQLLYCCLSDHTNISLPWGALTGIRPVKIPMNLLTLGWAEEEIIRHMFDVYFCSAQKAHLALDIAKKERAVLAGIDLHDSYSLYISVPFCPTTCLYCSFTSYPITKFKDMADAYLLALYKEIDFIADLYQSKRLLTIYIGGGTPTTLTASALEALLKKITASFNLNHLQEFTVEAGRPDSFDREKLVIMKKYHVNRISINPQSMNEKTLKLIGRNHTVQQVYDAFQLARELGFTNINMDIILGLPNETIVEVKKTLDKISELQPDSLTVHSLAIKRAAKLTEWVNDNGITTLNNTAEIMQAATECALALGMSPYYLYRQKNIAGNLENVGYAQTGKEGLYNILMMEEVQTIAALGAGSISKRVYEAGHANYGNIKRSDNLKEVDQYINRIDEMIEKRRDFLSRHDTPAKKI